MSERTTLIDNDYATLWFYPDDLIIHHEFHRPIADEAFRSVLMTGLGLMQDRGALKWLSDDRNNSILSAEDSAWSQDYWLPRALQAGWKLWAVLPPLKARGRINMERLMEFVGNTSAMEIQIFSDPEKALQWLKNSELSIT
ncbi:MAG: hypothetical protein ABW098_10915 [Candidatus Thiodiazotropha sp.]